MFLLKIIADPLGQDRRSERPEWLSLLDPLIQYILHVRTPRIDHNRPITQRARPEFHPALEPPNDQPVGYVARGSLSYFAVRMGLVFQPGSIELGLNVFLAELWPGISTFHYIMSPLAETLVIDVIARSDCCAAVSSGRLDEDPPERSIQQYLAVHNGVVRYAARQSQIGQPRFFMQVIQNMESDFLEPGLKTGGDILLAFAKRRADLPGRAKNVGVLV